MANDTIKGAGDVYEADLYADLRKSGNITIPVLQAMNDILAATSKVSGKIIEIDPKDLKSINQINEGIEETNKSFKQKIKIDKERIKIQRDITKAEKLDGKAISDLDVKVKNLTAARASLLKKAQEADEQRRAGNETIADAIKLTTEEQAQLAGLSKELILVKTERTELNKANKKLAQESLGLLDVYQQESKRLNELRKELKNFILSGKEATQETIDLAKEIDRLDKKLKAADATVGQFQRNVGNYPDTADEAADATEELGDEVEELGEKIIKFVAAAVLAEATLSGFKKALEGSAEASEELRVATAALEGGVGEVQNVAAAAALDLFDLGKAAANGDVNIWDLTKSVSLAVIGMEDLDKSATNVNKVFDRTTEATTDFTAKVAAAAQAEIEAERRTIAFEKAVRGLEIRLSQINRVIAEQGLIAGDTTRSFNEIEEAAVKAQKAQEQRTAILIKIAQEELDILRIRLNAQREAGKNVDELLNQETDAIVKLQDLRTDAAVEQLETDKLLRENARDRFERELDFAIDAFDAQKTVNERRISNEKNNLEERRKIFDETLLLADKSFNSQVKLVEDFTKQKLDFDALVNESDEEVIRQKIKSFNFDDVTLGRILEIIKERKLALQDLTDAQVDLTGSEQDAIDVKKDIIAQEEALSKITAESSKQSQEAFDNLEKDREANEIENLRRRLSLAKEGSKEALEIQKELNDALLDEQNMRIQKQLEADEKAAEQRKEIQKASIDLLDRASKASSDRKIEQIDKEISATEKQQDRLRELAEKGVLGADKSLAAEEKKQAELERQKQREARKQELRTAGFKILSALLEQGKSPQEAIPEVGVLLGALPAVIDAIPTFYKGTHTDVADALGKPHLNTKKDGYLIRADGKEKILNPGQASRTKGMTTEDITRAAEMSNNSMYNDLFKYNTPNIDNAINTNWQTNHEIMERFVSLENSMVETNKDIQKAIENKPVLTDVKFNKILKEMTTYYQEGNKTKKTRSKLGSSIF